MEWDILDKLAAGFNCVSHFATLFIFDLPNLLGFSQETNDSQKLLAALYWFFYYRFQSFPVAWLQETPVSTSTDLCLLFCSSFIWSQWQPPGSPVHECHSPSHLYNLISTHHLDIPLMSPSRLELLNLKSHRMSSSPTLFSSVKPLTQHPNQKPFFPFPLPHWIGD